MAEPSFYVYANGGWREVASVANQGEEGFFVRVGGAWKVVEEGFVRVNNAWKQFWPPEGDTVEPPPTKPPAGTYILAATAIWLPSDGSNGYVEFNTGDYRGWITEVYARVSWRSNLINGLNTGMAGRPNNRFYRNITHDTAWENRTIDHRMDTFNANVLTDFNNGAAYGFNIQANGLIISAAWSTVRLRIQIS